MLTFRLITACLVMASAVRATGMKLERDRLVNLESADTVGLLKTRFDFQHAFEDESLLPVADLTFILGVWDGVQIEAESSHHNFTDEFGPGETRYGHNVFEGTAKWTPLDQTRGALCSLALGAGAGQTHAKLSFLDASGSRVLGYNEYRDMLTVYAVASLDLPWIVPSVGYRAVATGLQRFSDAGGTPVDRAPLAVMRDLVSRALAPRGSSAETAYAPGLGLRVKAYDSKAVKANVVADYQFGTFAGSRPAWGFGFQFMFHAPHVMMLYASNTHDDTAAESVSGGHGVHSGFRWSYRF